MFIEFQELMSDISMEDNYQLIKYVVKQISRCKFEIIDDKCIVKARYKNEIIDVLLSNDISVIEFNRLLYIAEDEPSPEFMRSKICNYNCTIFEMLTDYKTNNYVIGEKIKEEILYKLYSRVEIKHPERKLYDAKWIDYESQLEKTKNVIYDEGVAGLWAMPAKMILECFNNECRKKYGTRVFILRPIENYFYLNDGKEIIGDRFEVIESLSLEDADDMGKLTKYLVDEEKRQNQRELLVKEKVIQKLRNERGYFCENYNNALRKDKRLRRGNKEYYELHDKKMSTYLRVLFIILIIAISGAALLQIFAPEYMGRNAAYGISTGWQREIGFWNIAVLVILITVYRHYNWIYLKSILLALILGGIGIGTNHLIHYLQVHQIVNLIGALENYLLVIAWIIGWKIEAKRQDE